MTDHRASFTDTAAYVAPFAAFVSLMMLERIFRLPPQVFYPVRPVITLLVILAFSRSVIRLRPSHAWASAAVGLAVFAIWVGPDLFFGYRHHWLFENAVTGSATSSMPPGLRMLVPFLAVRTFSSTFLVPVLEEAFWRGWLMRWLINPRFLDVPLGAYLPSAFWITAVIFASEHGPYWEVGLAAGIVYNLWLIRTKNLADCILAHAVTNGALSVYVILAQQWQYWL